MKKELDEQLVQKYPNLYRKRYNGGILVEKKEPCPVCSGNSMKADGRLVFVCRRCKGTGKITKYSVRSSYAR